MPLPRQRKGKDYIFQFVQPLRNDFHASFLPLVPARYIAGPDYRAHADVAVKGLSKRTGSEGQTGLTYCRLIR